MAKAAPEKSTADALTFEAAMERLDSLVEKMEEDRLPLDELLVRYEEGIRLVKYCSEKLSAAEQRIEAVTRDADGQVQLNPLEAPEREASSAVEETGVRLF